MPKIKEYQPKVSGPSTTITQPAFRGAANIAASAGAISEAIGQRAQTLMDRHDRLITVSALNEYRDQARVKLQELQGREGRNAAGVQQDYEQWLQGATSDIGSEYLKNDVQQRLFQEGVTQGREADLNRLAAHEYQQDKVYRAETVQGEEVSAMSDIASLVTGALDSSIEDIDTQMIGVDAKIGNHLLTIRELYPDHDTRKDEAEFVERARVSQMLGIIEQNPSVAEKYLDHYKPELGKSYFSLKAKLKGEIKQDRIDRATTALYDKFSTNLYGAVGYTLNPKNWVSLGIDGADEAESIANYFRGIERDKNQREVRARENKTRMQEKYHLDYLLSLTDPEVKRRLPPINEAAANQLVDDSFYKWWISGRDEAIEDDYLTILKHGDDSASGNLDRQAVINDTALGLLKPSTAGKIIADDRDAEKKQARWYITKALQPSENDRRFQDKSLKLVEALQTFEAMVSSGTAYQAAADAVIAQYTGHIRRNERNIGRSRFLTKTVERQAENAEEAVLMAKEEAARAYNVGRITAEDYRNEIAILDRKLDIIEQKRQVEESIDDNKKALEELRKRQK